jgi:hypothetical protein
MHAIFELRNIASNLFNLGGHHHLGLRYSPDGAEAEASQGSHLKSIVLAQ